MFHFLSRWLKNDKSRTPRCDRKTTRRSHRPKLETLEDRLAPAVNFTELTKLLPPVTHSGDEFGLSVAVDGSTAIVGAFFEDTAGPNAGAAYVFTRTGSTWSLQQKLTAPDAAAGDQFGVSVTVSGDTVVVGARQDDTGAGTDAGSAYVFTRSGSIWSFQQHLTASDGAASDRFGYAVAVAGDTAVVGAIADDTDAGSAYVFTRSGSTWSQQQKLTAADAAPSDLFGVSVAISGDSVVVGAFFDDTGAGGDAGSAYVFARSGTTWSQQAKLTASDGAASDDFGVSVAISGDSVVVGARQDDTGAGLDAGSAYVFTRSGTTWTQQQKLTASDAATTDHFGVSVSISGDTVVVGAYHDDTGADLDAGSAYVFGATGTTDVGLSGGDLVVTDSAGGDTNDTLTISLNGSNLRVHDPANALTAGAGTTQVNANTVEVALSSVTGQILVNTLGGNDTLTMNYGAGFFNRNVVYNGGTQTTTPGDRLNISGGSFTTAIYNYTNSNDGSINLDGTIITYTGLEPISNSGTATNVIFNLTSGVDNVELTTSGSDLLLDSLNGSFEDTTFNPAGLASLTINMGSGGDTMNLTAVTPGFSAHVTIDGQGDTDTANLSGAVNLGAGNLTITAETINANATVTTTGAAVLNATGGFITDGNGAAVNIVAASLRATASVGISLDTTIANLEASGGIGGVDIADSDALTIGGISGMTGVSAGGGSITLQAGGALTVSESITLSGAGSINLTASGHITVSSITHTSSGSVSLTSTGGSIIDDVNDSVADVTGNALTFTSFSGVGELAGNGSFDVNSGSISASATSLGGITLHEIDSATLNSISTFNGHITVTAGVSMDVNSVVSNTDSDANDITISAINLNVGFINAGTLGDVFLTGSVLGVNEFTSPNPSPSVVGDDLTVVAGSTGINLDTNVASVQATTSGNAPITLRELNNVSIVGTGLNSGTGLITLATIGAGSTFHQAVANAINDGSALQLNANATLNLATTSETIASLSGVAGSGVTLNGNTLTVGSNNLNTVYSGSISGAGGLTKVGTGTLTLTSNSSGYSGITTIASGTIELQHTGALGSSGVALNGSTLQLNPALASTTGLHSEFYQLTPLDDFANLGGGGWSNVNSLPALNNLLNGALPSHVGLTTTSLNIPNPGAAFPYANTGTFSVTPAVPTNIGNDNVVAVWSGRINLSMLGTYTFRSSSDDASMVFIDGAVVVNDNRIAEGFTQRTGTYTNTTVGLHDIVIVHYESTGANAGLTVEYDLPTAGTAFVVIPASDFSTPDDITVPLSFNNSVTVSGTSTIQLRGGGRTFQMLGLILNGGATLQVDGSSLLNDPTNRQLRFNSTTLGAGSTTITLNTSTADTDLRLGQVSDGAFTGINLDKTGPGRVIFDHTTSANDTSGTILRIQQGRVNTRGSNVAGSNNPLGGAPIELNGGILSVQSRNDATSGVTLANNISFSTDAAIEKSGAQDVLLTGTLSGTGVAAKTLTFDVLGGNLRKNTGIISGTAVNLLKVGPGGVILNAVSSYSGSTTLLEGTIFVEQNSPSGANGALGNSTSTVLVGDTTGRAFGQLLTNAAITIGRDIQVRSGSAGAKILGANSAAISAFTGNVQLDTSVILRSNNAAGTVSFTGTLSETAASNVTKDGAGTVVLVGSNTYSGQTSIQNGALSASTIGSVGSPSSNLGAPPTAVAATINLGSGTSTGTLIYTGAAETTNRVINLAGTTGGGVLDSDSATGALVFTSNFTATGAGSKTLTLQGSSAAAHTIQGALVNNSAANITSVTKTGTGLWVLSGVSTYSGVTNITAGTLRVTNSGSLGAGGSSQGTIASGGSLQLDAGAGPLTLAEPFLIGGGGVGGAGALQSQGGSVTLTGSITVIGNSATIGNNTAGTTLTIGGTFTKDTGADLTFTGAGNVTVNSAIANANYTLAPFTARAFNVSTLSIGTDAGINNVTGTSPAPAPDATNTLNAPLTFASDAAFTAFFTGGTFNANIFTAVFFSTLTAVTGGTYTFAATNNDDGAVIWLDRDGNSSFSTAGGAGNELLQSVANGNTAVASVTLAPGTYRIAYGVVDTGGGSGLTGRILGPASPVTVNGTLLPIVNPVPAASANSLTKTGSGTLTLTGNNTYAGGTTVNGGILLVNNITGSGTGTGNVVSNSGSTLGGTGTINSAATVTVNGTGRVAPGTTPGILNTGNVTFASSSFFDVELNGPTAGTGYDQLNVTGSVTLSGATLNLSLGYAPADGQTFTIVNNDLADAVLNPTFTPGAGIALLTPDGVMDDNDLFTLGGKTYRIDTDGGTGNDVVLTILPTVTITVSPSATAEDGATNLIYTFTRTGLTTDALTVTYSVGGTANGGDYSGATGTVTIPIGFSSADVTIDPTIDVTVEANETVILTITSTSPAKYLVGSPSTAAGTITDDDTATYMIDSVSVNEAAGTLTFTVTVSNPVDIPVTIDVTYADVSTIGGDFDHTADSVTFAALSTAPQSVTVAITNDNIVEATETFTASLSTSTALGGRSVNTSDTGTGTVTDNDTATYTINDVTVNELAGTLTFTVSVSNPVDIAVTIDVTYADVSTGAGDFDHTADAATFAALSTTPQSVTVAITDDNIVEATENFLASLGTTTALGGRSVNTSDTGTGTITDNDTATYSINDVSMNESAGTLTFTVSVSNPVDIAVTIDVAYADTTTGASDFDHTADAAVFAALSTASQLVTVAITNDNIVEATETFLASLSTATALGGRSVNTSDTGTGTITDNDIATYTIDDVSVNESSGTLTFTVSVSNPVDIPVTIDVNYGGATATGGGTDYDSATDSVTFGALSTMPQMVTVAITNDNIVEATETFTASLSTSTALGGRSVNTSDTGTGTITDNDTATYTIDNVTVNESAGTLTFTVSVSNPVDIPVTIDVNYTDVSTGSGDFDHTADSVTFGALSTASQMVTVAITNDNIVEATETFLASLSTATALGGRSVNTSDTGTGTITDNDTATYTINDVSVSESAGMMTFTVSVSNPVDIAVTINVTYTDGTATGGGTDYDSATDSVTFGVLDTADKMVTVAINNETLVELTESFTASLSTPTALGGRSVNTSDTGTGTITNDDTANITINDVTMNEGDSGTTSFTFSVTLSNPIAHTVTVDVQSMNGSATTADGDYVALPLTTLTFPGGSSGPALTQMVTVTVNGEQKFESTETFTVDLSNATYNGVSDPSRATITDSSGLGTIVNDDTPVLVQLVGGNLVITDERPSGGNDDITIKLISGGTLLEVSSPTATLGTGSGTASTSVTFSFASITGNIQADLKGGDDQLTVDFSGGNPIPGSGVSYLGGANGGVGDKLRVTGGSGFTSLTYNATGVGAGNLVINDGSLTRTISFTGLEPVTVTPAAGTTTVNINDGLSHTAVFTAGPGAGNNTVTIDGGLESLTFANPTGELIVNADAGSDTFTFTSLDASFRAALTVTGSTGPADTVNLNTALTLGSGASTGNVTIAVENINLNANINTDAAATAGSVSLTGAVTLVSSVAIDTDSTTDGNITITGATNGAFALTLTAGAGNIVLGDVGNTTALTSLTGTSTGTTTLNGNISTNGAVSLTGGQIRLTGSRTIDTLQAAAGAGGAVTLSDVSATLAGADLTINTSAAGGVAAAGGNVTLTNFNSTGGFFVNDLSSTTTGAAGGAGGSITLTGASILLSISGADTGDLVLAGANNLILAAGSVTIDTQQAAAGAGGLVNLDGFAVSGSALGRDLIINTSAAGAVLAAGGAVTLGTFGNTGGGQFVNDLTITTSGAAGGAAGSITLGGNILLTISGADTGDLTLAGGGNMILTGNRTIDTQQAAAGAGGAVNLDGFTVSGNALGRDLAINTSASGAVPAAGGNVQLFNFGNTGGQFVNDVTITTTGAAGGAAGTITLTGASILLTISGGDTGDLQLVGGGNLVLNTSVTIDTQQAAAGPGGLVNLDSFTLGGNALGHDLTIDTSASGAVAAIGGDVRLGDSGSAGGQFLNDVSITTSGAAGGAGGNITLTGANILLTISAADTGDLTLTGGGSLILNTNVTIDTQQAAAGAGGAVNLDSFTVSGNSLGTRDLIINTSASGAVAAAGGNVTLGSFGSAGGGFVNDLSVTTSGAAGGAGGNITLTGASISLDGAGDVGDLTLAGGGNLILNTSVTIDTKQGVPIGSGGAVSFDAFTVSGNAAGRDLIINTSSLAAVFLTGGGVTLGAFGSTGGGFFVNDVTITTTGPAGDGAVTLNGAITLAGDLAVTGGAVNVDAPITTTAGGGTVTFTNSGLLTIVAAGDISADGAVTQNGTGAVSTAGDITTTNDNVSISSAVTLTGAVVVSAGAGNVTFSSTVNGAFSLTVNSTGTTTFGGAVGGTTPLATVTTDAPGTTEINTGTFNAQGGTITFNDPVVVKTNTTLTDTGATGIFFNNTVNGDGLGPWDVTLVTTNSSAQIQLNGNIGGTNPLDVLTINDAGAASISGTLLGAGTSLVKLGGGTLTLLNTGNSYSGNTTITAGTLKLGASGVIPDGAGKGDVTDNGSLDMGGFNETINGLSGSGTVTNSGGSAAALTVGNDNDTTTFSGVIQNGASTTALTKVGTGKLTLSGASTYTGATDVQAGTLAVTGSTTSNTTVQGAATLAGTGTITGTVSVLANGHLAPGNGSPTAIFNTGSVAFTAGSPNSTFDVEINSGTAGSGYDQLNVTGMVNLDPNVAGGATLNVSGLITSTFNPTSGTFVIVNNDGSDGVTGVFRPGTNIVDTFGDLADGRMDDGDRFTIDGIAFHIFYDYLGGDDVALIINADPVITSITPSTQPRQYSDPTATVTITATDDQFTDLVATTSFTYVIDPTISGSSPGANGGGPGTLPYRLVLSSPTCVDGPSGTTCTWTVSWVNQTTGQVLSNFLPPPGTYTITVVVTDDFGETDTDTFTITVNKEDARPTYTGPAFVSTASVTSSTATVTLQATIQDITAFNPSLSPPSPDNSPGNITNARVTFLVYDAFTNALVFTSPVLNVGLIDPADPTTGSVSFNWTANIGNADAVQYRVRTVINNFYDRNNSADDVIVNVAKPLDNFITGGGYIVETASAAGQYRPDAGSRTNLGFNVKFNSSGTNLQGRINIIFRRTEGGILKSYQIKSNSLTSLGVDPATGRATVVTRANLQDVTNPTAPISIAGNLTLTMTVDDNGEPGSSHLPNDTIAITLYNGSTLWFSSNWNGAQTVDQVLNGGNIQVRPNNELLLSINDRTVTEGSGGTTTVTFTVTLSAAASQNVTVNYATANGTALAGIDYTATSGVLTFLPGQVTKTIAVTVAGDSLDEPDETFFINLSNANRAGIQDPTGIGLILDDDLPSPLHAARETTNGGSETLSREAVQPLLAEAIEQWHAAGADSLWLGTLAGLEVQIADLPGSILGLASQGLIVLDSDAAGYGWFVGRAADLAASGRVDLLTVISHEVGHLLGFEHSHDHDDLLAAALPPGVRRSPDSVAVDDHDGHEHEGEPSDLKASAGRSLEARITDEKLLASAPVLEPARAAVPSGATLVESLLPARVPASTAPSERPMSTIAAGFVIETDIYSAGSPLTGLSATYQPAPVYADQGAFATHPERALTPQGAGDEESGFWLWLRGLAPAPQRPGGAEPVIPLESDDCFATPAEARAVRKILGEEDVLEAAAQPVSLPAPGPAAGFGVLAAGLLAVALRRDGDPADRDLWFRRKKTDSR